VSYDVVLVDCMNLLHRAAHAYRHLYVQTPQGGMIETGPAFGFINMTLGIHEKFCRPGGQMIFCWDAGYQHRLEIHPGYKASRREKKEKPPKEDRVAMGPQVQAVRKLIGLAGWAQAKASGYEADDVMAALAARHRDSKSVAIYTGDQDLHQSVRNNVHVISGKSGKETVWTLREVQEKWGNPPERIAEMKGIIGDPGDDIPGCPKVGMVMAKKLFAQYGGVRKIIQAAQQEGALLQGEYNGKSWKAKAVTAKVAAHAEDILMSWELARVIEDCEVLIRQEDPNQPGLRKSFNFLEFSSLLMPDRWNQILQVAGKEPPAQTGLFDLFLA